MGKKEHKHTYIYIQLEQRTCTDKIAIFRNEKNRSTNNMLKAHTLNISMKTNQPKKTLYPHFLDLVTSTQCQKNEKGTQAHIYIYIQLEQRTCTDKIAIF